MSWKASKWSTVLFLILFPILPAFCIEPYDPSIDYLEMLGFSMNAEPSDVALSSALANKIKEDPSRAKEFQTAYKILTQLFSGYKRDRANYRRLEAFIDDLKTIKTQLIYDHNLKNLEGKELIRALLVMGQQGEDKISAEKREWEQKFPQVSSTIRVARLNEPYIRFAARVVIAENIDKVLSSCDPADLIQLTTYLSFRNHSHRDLNLKPVEQIFEYIPGLEERKGEQVRRKISEFVGAENKIIHQAQASVARRACEAISDVKQFEEFVRKCPLTYQDPQVSAELYHAYKEKTKNNLEQFISIPAIMDFASQSTWDFLAKEHPPNEVFDLFFKYKYNHIKTGGKLTAHLEEGDIRVVQALLNRDPSLYNKLPNQGGIWGKLRTYFSNYQSYCYQLLLNLN